MNRYILYRMQVALFIIAVLLLNACHIDHYGPEGECNYTVRIFYHYNRENTSRENVLPDYVKWMTAYIFDSEGILYATHPVEIDVCDGQYASELNLPPGRYSIIVVGNDTSMSATTDAATTHTPEVGVTHREDMLLFLQNETPTRTARGYFDNCGRLYHGYRTFSIAPAELSHVRVDMVHSHCVINYKVIWEGGMPNNLSNVHIRMQNMPSEYHLMPEFIYPEQQGLCYKHNPDSDDFYDRQETNCIHHIATVHNNRNYVNHRHTSTLFGQEATGEVITYRLRNEPEPGKISTFTVYDADKPLANSVPLNDFFVRQGINLDETLRQEYPLVFRINKDGSITVAFATVEDWDEGGWI
ncbi:FimB/Mfa2 family fimbrial subunit [Bacteroides sp. 224]|uniref:FimB/Mfa2 family fimbrial subunit n=1 Tax=Bacteroides sp. 224 TaxID=2302936 RepID=UPI0013D81941|nr:FimB/Mfa2 family fimbrial subunit [Bacteroides sp. 224]NDV64246.1 hypothetical protein [Bacteroides sp. 224]